MLDDPHEEHGRDLPVPGRKGKDRFKPLPDDLDPAKRAFVQALRDHFETGGLTLSQFAARYYYADRSTVWRYLTAKRMPDGRFVRDVLDAAEAKLGTPLTAQVREALEELHLAALAGPDDQKAYEMESLRRQLAAETLLVQAAQRQVEMLGRELAESQEVDARLRSQVRELEAAVDEQQVCRGADLAAAQAESSRLREDLLRSRERSRILEALLAQAQKRRVEAEENLERLERTLEATAQDAERERRAELRQAEEREQARLAEENAMRASLADAEAQAIAIRTAARIDADSVLTLAHHLAEVERAGSAAVDQVTARRLSDAARSQAAAIREAAESEADKTLTVALKEAEAIRTEAQIAAKAIRANALLSGNDVGGGAEWNNGPRLAGWPEAAALDRMAPGSAGAVLSWMNPLEAAALLEQMDPSKIGGVLETMDVVRAACALEAMELPLAAYALETMGPNRAAAILQFLRRKVAKRMWNQVSPGRAAEIQSFFRGAPRG